MYRKSELDVLNAVTKRILLGLFFQISHFDAMTSLKKLYECKPFCILHVANQTLSDQV